MEATRTLNKRYETAALGAFFILLGVTSLVPGVPSGIGEIGVGLILVGLNLARYASHIPTSGFTLILGIIALVLGIVDLLRAMLNPGMDLPIFPLLLILTGIVWLARGTKRRK